MSSQFKATGTIPVDAHRIRVVNGNNGPSTEYFWRGTKTFCESIFYAVGAEFDEQEMSHDGGTYEVTRRINMLPAEQGAETPQDEIRMSVVRVEKDIITHATFQKWVDSQSDRTEALKKLNAVAASLQNNEDITYFTWNDGDTDEANAKALYQVAQSGVKSYIYEAPTIVRTLTASRYYQFVISYLHCGKIISPSFIETHLNLTFTWPFNLPSDTDPTNNPFDLHYGWFKNSPDYSMAANRKAVYSQTFEYGLWAESVYGEPVTS